MITKHKKYLVTSTVTITHIHTKEFEAPSQDEAVNLAELEDEGGLEDFDFEGNGWKLERIINDSDLEANEVT